MVAVDGKTARPQVNRLKRRRRGFVRAKPKPRLTPSLRQIGLRGVAVGLPLIGRAVRAQLATP